MQIVMLGFELVKRPFHQLGEGENDTGPMPIEGEPNMNSKSGLGQWGRVRMAHRRHPTSTPITVRIKAAWRRMVANETRSRDMCGPGRRSRSRETVLDALPTASGPDQGPPGRKPHDTPPFVRGEYGRSGPKKGPVRYLCAAEQAFAAALHGMTTPAPDSPDLCPTDAGQCRRAARLRPGGPGPPSGPSTGVASAGRAARPMSPTSPCLIFTSLLLCVRRPVPGGRPPRCLSASAVGRRAPVSCR